MKKTFTSLLAIAMVFIMAFGFTAYAQPEAAPLVAHKNVIPVNLPAAPANAVKYSDHGAVGNGVADDFDAIIAAHAAANAAGLPVAADAGATYYIGNSNKTATIQTNTYWGNAKFILDDREVSDNDRFVSVFSITSKLASINVTSIDKIGKGQPTLDLGIGVEAFVVATNDTVRQYIRNGYNLTNSGTPMTDVLVVDASGNVHLETPVLWDFDTVTSLTAYPIDAETLTVSGGRFTTRANQGPLGSGYMHRGINVRRSNVVLDGIYHDVTDEETSGRPYDGFINIANCAFVTIQNTMLSGRKIVNAGSYDTVAHRASHLTYKNCRQVNDINSPNLWGIMGVNYTKNLVYDNVHFSRYDSHAGLHNAIIKDSVLGRHGINLIGSGTALIENTTVYASEFITLREDYGSTWDGDIIIRNCEFIPYNGTIAVKPVIIRGANSGFHDFGYQCYMPHKVIIDGLVIDDSNSPFFYMGPRLFSSFSSPYVIDMLKEFLGIGVRYPIVITEEVEISNLTIKSGKSLIKSFNIFKLGRVKVTWL